MLKRFDVAGLFKFALLPIIGYLIPMMLFVIKANYTASYLLYLSNGLFLMAMFAIILMFNRAQRNKTTKLNVVGHVITAMALAGITVVAVISIFILVPAKGDNVTSEIVPGTAGIPLTRESRADVMFMVLINNIIGNGSAGTVVV